MDPELVDVGHGEIEQRDVCEVFEAGRPHHDRRGVGGRRLPDSVPPGAPQRRGRVRRSPADPDRSRLSDRTLEEPRARPRSCRFEVHHRLGGARVGRGGPGNRPARPPPFPVGELLWPEDVGRSRSRFAAGFPRPDAGARLDHLCRHLLLVPARSDVRRRARRLRFRPRPVGCASTSASSGAATGCPGAWSMASKPPRVGGRLPGRNTGQRLRAPQRSITDKTRLGQQQLTAGAQRAGCNQRQQFSDLDRVQVGRALLAPSFRGVRCRRCRAPNAGGAEDDRPRRGPPPGGAGDRPPAAPARGDARCRRRSTTSRSPAGFKSDYRDARVQGDKIRGKPAGRQPQPTLELLFGDRRAGWGRPVAALLGETALENRRRQGFAVGGPGSGRTATSPVEDPARAFRTGSRPRRCAGPVARSRWPARAPASRLERFRSPTALQPSRCDHLLRAVSSPCDTDPGHDQRRRVRPRAGHRRRVGPSASPADHSQARLSSRRSRHHKAPAKRRASRIPRHPPQLNDSGLPGRELVPSQRPQRSRGTGSRGCRDLTQAAGRSRFQTPVRAPPWAPSMSSGARSDRRRRFSRWRRESASRSIAPSPPPNRSIATESG